MRRYAGGHLTGRALPCLAALLTIALAMSLPAQAHDRGTSYSTWTLDGRTARVVVRVAELELSHFPWALDAGSRYDELAARYLTNHLQLLAGDSPCQLSGAARRLTAPPGRATFEWRLECAPEGALGIRTGLFLDVAPTHLHFARVRGEQGSARERVLSEAQPVWDLDDASAAADHPGGTSFVGFVALGVEHILSGYDHLAFVLALLLIGGSFAEVARVVTGFTLAHSITLGLTVLGYVQPDNAPVEALIGLSIFLVAAENAWLLSAQSRLLPIGIALALAVLAVLATSQVGNVPAITLAGLALFTACYFELLRNLAGNTSLRWAVAFLFGLVHGFGFASVLGEAGLPPDRIVPALLGFNLGVEIGQLAVVALVWPALRMLLRHDASHMARRVVEIGSAAVAGLGLFWFVARSFG